MTGVLPGPARPRSLPPLVRGLCDDAAIFPPGCAPLDVAVTMHREHLRAWYAELVGPLVVDHGSVGRLRGLVAAAEPVALAVTFPGGPADVPTALAAAADAPGVRLRAVEIAVPAGPVATVLADLDRATAGVDETVDVAVEIPRDARRDALLARLSGTRYRAKFRTGGTRADLHPGPAELAAALRAAVDAGVPFKATAGLHHAVRNTDPLTGFDQHGFLNLGLAVDALLQGADDRSVRDVLAERAPGVVAAAVAALPPARVTAVRARFTSFGTCSIADPLADMVALGLVRGPGGAA